MTTAHKLAQALRFPRGVLLRRDLEAHARQRRFRALSQMTAAAKGYALGEAASRFAQKWIEERFDPRWPASGPQQKVTPEAAAVMWRIGLGDCHKTCALLEAKGGASLLSRGSRLSGSFSMEREYVSCFSTESGRAQPLSEAHDSVIRLASPWRTARPSCRKGCNAFARRSHARASVLLPPRWQHRSLDRLKQYWTVYVRLEYRLHTVAFFGWLTGAVHEIAFGAIAAEPRGTAGTSQVPQRCLQPARGRNQKRDCRELCVFLRRSAAVLDCVTGLTSNSGANGTTSGNATASICVT